MPTEKRQRQREGRQARREEAKAAQKRAARRRQVLTVVVLVAVVLGIGFLLSRGDDDGAEVATDQSTSTSSKGVDEGTAPCPPAEGTGERKTTFDGPPKMCIDVDKDYKATIETDVGSFTIDLAEKDAQLTVNNFVFLARYEAYDGVPFHRVIPDFVVQGGDVEKGDGTGGPGYQIDDELPEPGDYGPGSVAMANSGPHTNGSQFFVVTSEQGAKTLVEAVGGTAKYSLFGTVTAGMDVVKTIEADGTPEGTPSVVHNMIDVKITES